MNLLSSDSTFRSFHTSHGSSKEPQEFWEWADTCNVCAKQTQSPRDIFCGNYGVSRGSYPSCRNSWCSGCYRAMDLLKFPCLLLENDEGQVWRKAKDTDRFQCARRGDTLCAPFQCDFCWFTNLKGRTFNSQWAGDRLVVALIRRVNLDIFWSREASTVEGLLRLFNQTKEASRHLGVEPDLLRSRQGGPLGDNVGFREAVHMLWQSLQKAKGDGSLKQFDTVWKLRSLSAAVQTTGHTGRKAGMGFRDNAHMLVLTQCSTNSLLFSQFMNGCEKRMGRRIKQDTALSVGVLLQILENLEVELRQGTTEARRKREIIILGSFLVIGFCDALRGNEVFMVEASSLCNFWTEGQSTHHDSVIIPLMGQFKGETGERNVLRVLVRETKSGIAIACWVGRLVTLLRSEGRDSTHSLGPAFCDKEGQVLPYSFVNELFHAELELVQDAHPNLIPSSVEVGDIYNLFRSLRRGATSRATELNYPDSLINLNNRWRVTQTNKGVGGLKRMSQLYVEMKLVMGTLREFSASL